jgi:hypothetical protein
MLSPTSVVGGGEAVRGTVSLGGPAPAEGATITLSSGDTSLLSFPDGPVVTIPAGANNASFAVAKSQVATATTGQFRQSGIR